MCLFRRDETVSLGDKSHETGTETLPSLDMIFDIMRGWCKNQLPSMFYGLWDNQALLKFGVYAIRHVMKSRK